MIEQPEPPFAAPFTCTEAEERSLTVRYEPQGQWWRFSVADKNGRLQLMHEAHGAGPDGRQAPEAVALDAYDFATLEARRRGWVD